MIGSHRGVYATGSFIELFDNIVHLAVLQLFCHTGEPALMVVAQVVGVTVTVLAWEPVGQVCVRQRRSCESSAQVDTPVVEGRQTSTEQGLEV